MYRPTITELRKRREMSMEECAEKAGISRTSLFDIEHGNKSPTVRTLNIICGVLDISINDIDLSYYAN